MAPSTILFLSAFFLSLLLLTVPSHCILDPASATLAISQATGTVCGITVASQNHSIQCTTVQESTYSVPSFPIDATLSFDSISGGHNFICSLRSGDASFFCWDAINLQVKRVYSGPTVLTELSVGARQVATIEGDPMKMQTIRWWRYGCHTRSQPCRDFPQSIDGVFHSLTSGDIFTCAIGGTHEVHCWGPHAKSIMMKFTGEYMRSVTAGGSRMCGLNMTGHLICSGGQWTVPPGEAFEFTSLAIGSSHTCAIRRKNGTVVCWGRYGSYFPMNSTRFEFLVAGGDLTCGLTTDALNVVCWGLRGRNLSAITLSLPQILPGVCIPDETFCSCGVYPDSGNLCGGSGIICRRSDTCQMESFEPPRPLPLTTWGKLGKWWFVFAVFGAVFLTAVISYLICLMFGWCGKKDSNEDNEEGNLHGPGNNPGTNQLIQEALMCLRFGWCGKKDSNEDREEGNLHGPGNNPGTNQLVQESLTRLMFGWCGKKNSNEDKEEGNLHGHGNNPGTNQLVQEAEPILPGMEHLEIFCFNVLKAATDQFSKRARLGKGTYGAVYLGQLSDGRQVAVKHCHTQPNPDREIVFNTELETLANARHANVVSLIGYCKENDEQCSVFEYMAQKDLYWHLHPKRQALESQLFKSWRLRTKILLDAARGIEYLHRSATPKLIHRDIKSTNILINRNWVAKISDFGFALIWPGGVNSIEVDEAVGTIGYVDPKCSFTTPNGMVLISPQSDVYSFGVVMMEVLTGHKAFENDRHLGDLVVPRGHVVEVLDNRLPLPEGRQMDAILLVMEIAQECIREEPWHRYNMTAVVSELTRALALFDQPEESNN